MKECCFRKISLVLALGYKSVGRNENQEIIRNLLEWFRQKVTRHNSYTLLVEMYIATISMKGNLAILINIAKAQYQYAYISITKAHIPISITKKRRNRYTYLLLYT